MRKRIFYLVFITILIIGALFLFLKRKQQPIDRIILITIDTLRADHLGCYGYPRNTSPFIDSLAKKGIVFQRALCPMPTTSPSHASIFTSLYPIQHNVFKNGHKLANEFITLAELLRKINYRTAGVASTYTHFKAGNINQGFEYFNEPSKRKIKAYRQANKTIDVVMQWLDKMHTSDKFFLWIHLFDPHVPLRPPALYLDRISNNPEEDKESFVRFLLEKHHIDFGFYENKTGRMLKKINEYDGEILFADTEIRRFYNYYKKKGFNSKTMWIITADHGEGLGNHRRYGHGKHLYNEQLYVPLIFYFSSDSFQGISRDEIVELVDIAPTVIELAGGSTKELHGQIKTVKGTSLVSLYEGRPGVFPEKYAFAQRRTFSPENRPEIIIPEETNYEDGKKYALQDKNYKYIHRTQGEDEFFNLKDDPYELNNIAGGGSEEEKKFRNMLISKLKELEKEKSMETESVDQETIEKLKALGYIK